MNNDYIKEFCQIPLAIKLYDSKIALDKKVALTRLKIAGVSTNEENDLVKDFIATYCRLQLVSEPSQALLKMETERMKELIVLLTYGTFDSESEV